MMKQVNGVYFFFFFSILFLCANTGEANKLLRNKQERLFNQMDVRCKSQCGFHTVSVLASEATLNCWKRCLSPPCYELLYGNDPLEEGEIDERAIPFKKCFNDKITLDNF